MRYRVPIAILAIAFSALFVTTARAALITFEANLDGLQVAPPNASPGLGFGKFSLNDVTGAVNVLEGTYADLLGTSMTISINGPAAVGQNAATLISLTNDTFGATSGTFSGGGTLPMGNILDMIDGNTYVVVRSSFFPVGEIRGQILAVPEPATAAFLMVSGLLALRRSRRKT